MSFLLSQETNAWSIDKKITSYLFPFFPSLGYCVIGLLRANKMLQQEISFKPPFGTRRVYLALLFAMPKVLSTMQDASATAV